MTEDPYCKTVPTLLRAWDQTMLGYYMECPRKFWYKSQGWRRKGDSAHTEFGGLYHATLDLHDKAIAGGASKADALDAALKFALEATYTDGVYWSGEYRTQWRCTGKIKRKKCPYAKKWHDGEVPQEECGTCHGKLEQKVNWITAPGYKWKNRYSLIRSLVEYSDAQPEVGGVRPFVFPDGRVASELSFRLDLPFDCPDGVPYILTGNIDGMVQFAGEVQPRERKTTKNQLDDRYFAQYAPNVQIDTYDLASHLNYGDTLKTDGVMLEAMQIAIGFSKSCRRFIHVPPERREEWFGELEYWIKQAEANAKAGYWPKNTTACGKYGGCPFQRICKLAPSARERWLPEFFEKVPWNPLQER